MTERRQIQDRQLRASLARGRDLGSYALTLKCNPPLVHVGPPDFAECNCRRELRQADPVAERLREMCDA